MKKVLLVAIIAIFFIAGKSQSQELDGDYKVGNTSCTIVASKMSYKVYWDNGEGYTVLFYNRTLNNGKVEFNEFEDDGDTYTGKFVFSDDYYDTGEYIRNDGKKFKVYRLN